VTIAVGENPAAPGLDPPETTTRWPNLALDQLCSQRKFWELRLNICKILCITRIPFTREAGDSFYSAKRSSLASVMAFICRISLRIES
jgi:hypothetical protein